MQFYPAKITSHQKIAPEIFIMEVAAPAQERKAGQFYMLKGWENEMPLMRPVSIFKTTETHLTFLYKVVGQGTAFLSKMKRGASISLLGPLGNGFPCEELHGKVALVGGGVGIPPMFETAKKLSAQGVSVDLYLGYKKEIFCHEEFVDYCSHIFIASESGNEGYKGFITDLIHYEEYDAVLTCGPEAMMKKIREACLAKNIPVWLSMEKRMACGIGACLVCSCETAAGMMRCCKEGPVFNGKDLVFND
jgi:dihydroorotate dehydrogenase electron transfer subunit